MNICSLVNSSTEVTSWVRRGSDHMPPTGSGERDTGALCRVCSSLRALISNRKSRTPALKRRRGPARPLWKSLPATSVPLLPQHLTPGAPPFPLFRQPGAGRAGPSQEPGIPGRVGRRRAEPSDAPGRAERPGAGHSVLGPGQDRPSELVQPRVSFPFLGRAVPLHTPVTPAPAVLHLTSW